MEEEAASETADRMGPARRAGHSGRWAQRAKHGVAHAEHGVAHSSPTCAPFPQTFPADRFLSVPLLNPDSEAF